MPLAAGGMARIYIGRTTGIGSFERHVVLKLITPERANDHTAVQMFLDEARLAASLNHQNVAQVFEVGEDGGIHYLAMEYVHGQDLRALLAKAGSQGTRVPLELALTAVTGAAAGLNHAHERRGSDGVPLGIVHRDVSPSNIMIGYDGSVKLLDFGIAKATARSIETQSGIIKGKFAYMAPEQCRGRDVDRRSDVFSLGIILYEITTQHRCFRADSDFDTMHRIVTGDVVRPTRLIQGYPPALEAIVLKALAVDPTQRYQSAGALLEAIESFAMASRMSLSNMSLGRFMRDMFGDLTEPWLNNHGRNTQPIQPRESTISNTNGTGSDPSRAAPATLPPISEPSPPGSRTVLDLPRGSDDPDRERDSEPSAAEWNAKSYPTMQPSYASNSTLSPDGDVRRTSSPSLTAIKTPVPAHASQPIPALGSQPLPVMSQAAPGSFVPDSGSGSGPAHGAMPPVSTRQGYASAPGMTRGDPVYPRYERQPGTAADTDGAPELKPNRRPLFIGLGIAGLGFVVLLLMTLGGGDEDPTRDPIKDEPTINMGAGGPGSAEPAHVTTPTPTPTPTTTGPGESTKEPVKTGSGAVTPGPDTAKPAAGSADAPSAQVADTSISIKVSSEPTGADVLLAGKVIGTTPLETKIQRGSGRSMITIHKSRYADVTKEIDLSSDYADVISLTKEEQKVTPEVKKAEPVKEPKRTRPPEIKRPTNQTKTTPPGNGSGSATSTPKKPACQVPSQYDPLDSRPVCK